MKPIKQFEYKGGIATRINNPDGNNRHTPKEQLKPKQPKHQYTVDDVKALFQDMRIKYREYLSAVQKHSEGHYKLMGYRVKVELKEDE